MKISIDWLKELVQIKDLDEVIHLLPLRTIGTKEITEQFIELDMKGYNRSDLLSIRGIAREVAAITDSKINFVELTDDQFFWVKKSLGSTPVSIKDEELCIVQAVAKIEGLKVEHSNDIWVKKLSESGMRSINNIADITNLVMLEYGHPLHAFDGSTVKDETINVRRAKEGEQITTLDGKLRKLTNEDLVLADTEKALDVAGVMGGKNTEVKKTTSTILLSASLFNPIMVRQTSNRLKLRSEASRRFYHGLTKKRLFQALDAAIRMYLSIGGKLTSLTIVGESDDQVKKIPLSLKKVNDLIGIELDKVQVEDYLIKLNFELRPEKNAEREIAWVVTPPYYRLDIEIEEDLVEEVARMYGYERIKPHKLSGKLPEKIDQSLFSLISKLKTTLVDLGLTEVQTYSFYSTKVFNALGFNDESKKVLIKLENPMSSETEYLRMNLWPNLLEVIDKNIRENNLRDIAIFEIGKIFYINKEGKQNEKYVLSVALMNNTDNPLAELFVMYQKLNKQLKLGIENTKVSEEGAKKLGLFHPNRIIQLIRKNKAIGDLGEVHKRVTDKIGINQRVAILEIGIPKFLI